jgi:cytoskeleton protein RodZ
LSAEIGSQLKRAREAVGYTLEDLEHETRIPRKYLVALESGQLDSLPSPYYVRSYLRAYAHCVGLDARSLLKRYQDAEAEWSSSGTKGLSRTSRMRRVREPLENTGSRRSLRSSKSVEETFPPKPQTFNREEDGEVSPLSRSAGRKKKGGFWSRKRHKGVDTESPRDEAAASFEDTNQVPAGSTGRRVKMPPDLPAPQEIGLPSPVATPEEERGSEEESVQLSRRTHRSAGDSPAGSRTDRLSRTAKSKSSDEEDGPIAIWYTRFLIVGALLLIPAALWLLYTVAFGDSPKENSAGNKQTEASPEKQDQPASTQEKNGDPKLTPMSQNENGADHYELTNAEEIQLEIEAEGECWLDIRSREVGGSLKEATLQKGDSLSYTYKDGDEIWIEMGRPEKTKIKVNGQKLKVDETKKVHITLLR